MEHKININLLIRMYCNHGYTVQDICMRLRYPQAEVDAVIKHYKLEYGKSWND
jgi:hypothetical protein